MSSRPRSSGTGPPKGLSSSPENEEPKVAVFDRDSRIEAMLTSIMEQMQSDRETANGRLDSLEQAVSLIANSSTSPEAKRSKGRGSNSRPRRLFEHALPTPFKQKEEVIELGFEDPNDEDDTDNYGEEDVRHDDYVSRAKDAPQSRKVRKSILQELENAQKVTDSKVKYYTAVPSYEHIKLKSLAYKEVFNFLFQVREYMRMYPTAPLPLFSRIEDETKSSILSRNKILDDAVFNSLSPAEVIRCIQVAIRPFTRTQFNRIIKSSVFFDSIPGFTLNLINFHRFSERNTTFIRHFIYLYDFLIESLSNLSDEEFEEIVPPNINRDEGIVQIFLDKLPSKFGKTVWKKIGGNGQKRYRTFHEFIEAYKNYLEPRAEFSVQAQAFQSELSPPDESGKQGNNYLDSKMSPSEKETYERQRSHKPNQRPFQKTSLHHVSFGEHDTIDEVERWQLELYEEDFQGLESEATAQDAVDVEHLSGQPSKPQAMDAAEDDVFDDEEDDVKFEAGLNALIGDPSKSGPTPRMGAPGPIGPGVRPPIPSRFPPAAPRPPNEQVCFKMLYTGTCLKHHRGMCPYKHDSNSLEVARDHNIEKLRKDLWRDNADKSRKEEEKGFAPGPPKKPPPDDFRIKKEINELNRKPGTFYFREADRESETQAQCLNAILSHISSESALIKAVMADGLFFVGEDLYSGKCLLDSGALEGSYIDKAFLDGFRHFIAEKIKPCRACVSMADEVTKVYITEYLDINLMFKYKDSSFVINEKLMVMPTLGQEIIIGLPTIVKKILPMYCAMLMDVAEYLASQPDAVINHLIQSPWTVMEEDAPEDIETPLPSSFPVPLHYLSITHEEAVEEYHKQFDEHIAPEFRLKTDIEKLLKSKTGVDTFVPSNWDGINGIGEGIEFNWKPGMPQSMKPPARPVNPRLFGVSEQEFRRLRTYFYQESDSPIASPLVIAPKATKPFIRFCGDYSILVNKYIETGHYPIPNVFNSIQKITNFKLFCDFDLANSFHQFRLGPVTRRKLSVQTPWGQYEPLFMPEGVPPASGILQKHMESIFAGFEEWTIVIFDNLLVLAIDEQDAYNKCAKILSRCNERNLVLKFSKTWLGFDSVEFFGYKCSYKKFELTDKRRNAIMEMPFPKNLKQMQRFLGCALFFRQFVANYAEHCALLSKMTEKSFNWDSKTWDVDYVGAFENFKQELMKKTALFYPDFDLPWILRVDASEDGIGWVLMQDPTKSIPNPKGPDPAYQPLVFGSKKFSKQAYKWDTFNKEAYAMYYSVKDCEYLLRGKHFTLQGDHANLRWIEASQVPKVIRWRVYLQSFDFEFDHIKGTRNIVADWQSRLFYLTRSALKKAAIIPQVDTPQVDAPSDTAPSADETGPEFQMIEISQADMLKEVHSNSRAGHFGVSRTYQLLNKRFPGHGISSKQVQEYVRDCPLCQKVRLGMETALVPIVRTLNTRGPRKLLGIDYLEMERDSLGNIGCYVTRDMFTKKVFIYPVSEHNATTAATALFLHCVYFAAYDSLISDPGFDFTSDMVKLLNMWFGSHHIFSLVDRHESNGVEGANKQILRHVKTLICDERIRDRWSTPSVIGWVQYLINKFDDSESGLSPYELTFGSDVIRNLRFPSDGFDLSKAPTFLKQLNKDLQILRDISTEFQAKTIKERTANNPVKQNMYQKGDFILFKLPTDRPLPSKLLCRFQGPYVVLDQYKNDVKCRHLARGNIQEFYVGDVKPIHCTEEQAMELARVDADQFLIESIIAHRGNPHMRTSMEFFIKFQSEQKPIWRTWDIDLFQTEQYAEYCSERPSLFQLVYSEAVARAEAKTMNSKPIVAINPGDKVYLDLRFYGTEWYRQINLPEKDFKAYVVECIYQNFVPKSNKTKITALVRITNDLFTFDHVDVYEYGSVTSFDSTYMILVDDVLLRQFPQIFDRSGIKVHRRKK